MALLPDSMVTLSNLLMGENRACDWRHRKSRVRAMRRALKDSLAKKQNFAPPFHAFEFEYTPKELLLNSRYLSRSIEASARAKYPARKPPPPALDPARPVLHVAYTNGAGFVNGTTTARCLQSVFRLHDRRRVKVLGYALSGNAPSPERERIASGCDVWVEAAGLDYPDLARRMAADKVHVLVDTTGYTMRQKTEAMVLSPAPVVLSFHGFPGTMGASFVHYLSSDPRTTPPDYAGFYSERLGLVPWTYLINDHRQSRREVLAPPPHPGVPTRAELGFGEGDVVLASFNQMYKVEPKVFEAWMQVLARVPRARLWMLKFSTSAPELLREEAARRGVQPSRLVFHDKFPHDTELLAKAHADLFLDTPLFNAHTTGGDVLWAGIPVLTLPGDNFAKRVASGLVHSAGLLDLTCARSLDDYVALAVQLCRRGRVLRRVRRRLREAREALPLFDTRLLTAHLERSMAAMWEVYAAGLKPMHVVVAA
mmetsp:Transcript_18506/g.51114  ORF Transcript_18506/g.51114 Transcript_18506/m.51114 type:complete len:482 (+) Transcript_18506:667-2112(+)